MNKEAKDNYLKNFPRPQNPDTRFGKGTNAIAMQIVSYIKKEGITYEDGYACLQAAYELLKYESNFVKVQ